MLESEKALGIWDGAKGKKSKARQTSVTDLRDSAPSRSCVSPPTPKAMTLPRQSVITQGWLPGSPGWLGEAMLNAWPVLSGSSDGWSSGREDILKPCG